MAKSSKEARKQVKLCNKETGTIYYTSKNTKNTVDKLQLYKFDPKLRKKALFIESK